MSYASIFAASQSADDPQEAFAAVLVALDAVAEPDARTLGAVVAVAQIALVDARSRKLDASYAARVIKAWG